MSVASSQFRAGMRLLAGGVTIITTEHDGRRAGMTATAVCSLSADPPRLLACVNRSGFTYACIHASRHLCVNLLSIDQHMLARAFAGQVEGDRFEAVAWSTVVSGAPALDRALASFDCAVGDIVDAGSHGVLLCDVLAVRMLDGVGQPLIYCDGAFASIERRAA